MKGKKNPKKSEWEKRKEWEEFIEILTQLIVPVWSIHKNHEYMYNQIPLILSLRSNKLYT
jgi:hypothetical protein